MVKASLELLMYLLRLRKDLSNPGTSEHCPRGPTMLGHKGSRPLLQAGAVKEPAQDISTKLELSI